MSKLLVIIEFSKNVSNETKSWFEEKLKSIGLLTKFSENSKKQVLYDPLSKLIIITFKLFAIMFK